MATGASTADVAVVLIDAKAYLREGKLLPQSRRHTYIAALLGIPHVVAAVNKMDLVDYAESTFASIRAEFVEFATKLGLKSVTVIPVSALEGDNVVSPSAKMPWYDGPTLLEFLETVPLAIGDYHGPLRFPVQLVVRPDANFRGFAGQVARGMLRQGDRVMALPSKKETTVKRIVTWDGDLPVAAPPQSITVELEDEIDLSRGEMLVPAGDDSALPQVTRRLRAMVVWMHEEPLVVGRTYLAKHTTRSVRATVKAIRYRIDVNSLEHLQADHLAMNEIAEVELETNLPLFFDAYTENRMTGSLILIDGLTNATVGAAMIAGAVSTEEGNESQASLVVVAGRADLAERLRDALEARGHRAVLIDDSLIPDASLTAVVRALDIAGVTAITSRQLAADVLADVVRATQGFAEGEVVVGDGLEEDEILRLAGVRI
jgi:bifunctional enzyme CysN/CysC/sulfate adenylyltransferase subunit 1